MTTLNDALIAVGIAYGMDAEQLILFAAEDTIPGSKNSGDEPDPGRDETAIPYTDDGKFLYALIRLLKPDDVLEIGTNRGGSAAHIAAALEANGKGHLLTIDINPDSNLDGVPENLRYRVSHVKADASEWLNSRLDSVKFEFDFIHEDGSHTAELVEDIYTLIPEILNEYGYIVSHDTALGIGYDVRRGMANAGFKANLEVHYDGSPCGFSLYQYAPEELRARWKAQLDEIERQINQLTYQSRMRAFYLSKLEMKIKEKTHE